MRHFITIQDNKSPENASDVQCLNNIKLTKLVIVFVVGFCTNQMIDSDLPPFGNNATLALISDICDRKTTSR